MTREPCPMESSCPVEPGCHICGWTKKEKAEEEKRRRAFIKAAHDIAKIWPGHARPRPPATNETDRYTQELLRTSLAALVDAWDQCRAGTGTERLFEAALEVWRVERLRAAGVFGEEA